MAMSIHAGKTSDLPPSRDGIVVPPASVWAGGRAEIFCVNPVHVRTLGGSNARAVGSPADRQKPGAGQSNTGLQHGVRRSAPGAAPSHWHYSSRSITENLKQWAGGALFGLAIFGGILFAQQGQEEPLPTYSESQMAGLDVTSPDVD